MGSGMNLEQAKTYAEKMSYSQAVYNALCGYGIPYRKATKIKLNELLDVAKNIDARHAHWELAPEDTAYDNVWICSNCGEDFTQHRKPKFIYCPNCGAKDGRGRRMRLKNKIFFYKGLLIEICETLESICLYLEYDARRMRNPTGEHMRGHFNELKEYSQELRNEQVKPWKRGREEWRGKNRQKE